jgi:lipid-binding SYLF domain-containing protein
MKNFVLTLLVMVLLPRAILTEPKNKEAKRLEASAKVLQEIMDTTDSAIPSDLLDRCERISIILSMKKG